MKKKQSEKILAKAASLKSVRSVSKVKEEVKITPRNVPVINLTKHPNVLPQVQRLNSVIEAAINERDWKVPGIKSFNSVMKHDAAERLQRVNQNILFT